MLNRLALTPCVCRPRYRSERERLVGGYPLSIDAYLAFEERPVVGACNITVIKKGFLLIPRQF